MDSVDIKGIAWVGNIYQKFEAMCMEVEAAMCQETTKYVENQVQTVSASMKRFCSDVMQDLIPPSSKNLTRVASADILLNPYLEFGIHKRSISSIKDDAIDPVRIKDSCKDKSKSSNDVWEDWSTASFNWEISDKDEDCDRLVSNEALKSESRGKQERVTCNQIVNSSLASPAPSTAVSTKSSSKVVKRSRRISTSNIIKAERTDASESRGLVSQIGSQVTSNTSNCQSNNGDVSHTVCAISAGEIRNYGGETRIHVEIAGVSSSQTGSHISSNTQCGQSVIDEPFRSHTGSSADCDPGIKEDNNTSVQMMESIGHDSEESGFEESGFEESGFEESCVLVDGSDYCLDSKEDIRRSYKTKIQSAFSLKKKYLRKQEYKQLALQYGNSEPNIQGEEAIPLPLAVTVSKNIKAKKLATLDSLDSEWELL